MSVFSKALSRIQLATFSGWPVAVCVPLLFLTNYRETLSFRAETSFNIWQILSVALLVFAAALGLLGKSGAGVAGRLSRFPLSLLLLIMWFFCSSIWSINPQKSVALSIATAAVFLCVFLIMSLRNARHLLASSAIFVWLFLIFVAISLPYSGRTFGGIQANTLGGVAYYVICFSMLFAGKTRLVLIGSMLAYLVVVSSRSFMLATALFFLAYYFYNGIKASRAAISILSVSIAVLLLAAGFSVTVQDKLVEGVQLITRYDSNGRGLDSGLTGRVEFWSDGLATAAQKPLIGFGFRTRESTDSFDPELRSAHGGFINLTLDVGLFGLAIFLVAYAAAIRRSRRSRTSLEASDDTRSINRICFSILASYPVLLVLEPSYLYVALPANLALIVALVGQPASFSASTGVRQREN